MKNVRTRLITGKNDLSLLVEYQFHGLGVERLHGGLCLTTDYHLFLLAFTQTGSSLITGLFTAITPERLWGT